MDPLEIVQSTADASFATDENGRIVIWNPGAERLLGLKAGAVLGKPCHETLCGTDAYGNRYCDEQCSISRMAARGEPIHRFEIDIRKSGGQLIRVAVSILVVRGPRPTQFTIIHLLEPCSEDSRVAGASEPSAAAASIGAGPPTVEPEPPLTAREVEVLRHLAGGLSTREIADSLFISVATVRTHVQNILQKLDVHSQVQAVSVALRKRLI